MITASALEVLPTSECHLWDRCASVTGYSRADLSGPRRFGPLARARFQAYGVFYRAGYTLCQIGDQFNRHHTTIIHGLRSLKNETI